MNKNIIKYHGRYGKPIIHTTEKGRKYIIVRDKGGGIKRLYNKSLYNPEKKGKKKIRLKI